MTTESIVITVGGRRLRRAGQVDIGGGVRRSVYTTEGEETTYELIPLAEGRVVVTQYGTQEREEVASLAEAVAVVNRREGAQDTVRQAARNVRRWPTR